MSELTSKLLDQAVRDGLVIVTQERDRNDPDNNWREIDYVQPTEAESENALYGWAKYRVVARKPTDAETADCIGETFAEAANEF